VRTGAGDVHQIADQAVEPFCLADDRTVGLHLIVVIVEDPVRKPLRLTPNCGNRGTEFV
jgi:hypothetical protein